MSLPKIIHPTFELEQKSTGNKHKFRTMLAKEDKILYMAKMSNDKTEILAAILQVVDNCLVDIGVDVKKFTLFDVESFFLKIRAASVNNISKVAYKDGEDDKVYEFEIDLNTVDVKMPEKPETIISVGDALDTKIELGYPKASIWTDKEFLEQLMKNDGSVNTRSRCIERVYQKDKPFTGTVEEMTAWVEDLPIAVVKKIDDFLNNMPTIYHKIEYKNSLGNDRVIELSSLDDFFTLR